MSLQESTVQVIQNFRPMVEEILKRYQDKNNKLMPVHIIYFRDGVSESEFNAVKMQEGKVLRDLCPPGTKITIVISIKRHHTRFFCDRPDATKLGK